MVAEAAAAANVFLLPPQQHPLPWRPDLVAARLPRLDRHPQQQLLDRALAAQAMKAVEPKKERAMSLHRS